MKTENPTIRRVQLDLPAEKIAELDELMRLVNLTTRKDLFNSALTLFEWAVRESKAGRVIASVDETTKSYRELLMAPLIAVKKGS